jgi:hypothetical protein
MMDETIRSALSPPHRQLYDSYYESRLSQLGRDELGSVPTGLA